MKRAGTLYFALLQLTVIVAITCAAVDDVSAWTLLTFVVAIARTSQLSDSLVGLGWVLVYLVAMIFGVRPISSPDPIPAS